jgi:PAS domain S-box-containing protein
VPKATQPPPDASAELEALRCRVAELEAAEAAWRKAEAALARSEAFTQRLVEGSPLGILYLDRGGIITYENPAMRRIMGVPPGSHSPVIGLNISQIAAIREANILPLMDRCRQGETVVGQVVHYRSLMGVETALELHVAPLLGQAGEWEGAIVMARDISQRLEAEEEIRRRNRDLAVLNRVIAASASIDSIEPILEIVCRELAQALELPYAVAALTNRDRSIATVVAEYRHEGFPPFVGAIIPIGEPPGMQAILADRVPVIVNDAQDHPRLAPVGDLLRRAEATSLLLVPLIVEGEMLGGLAFGGAESRSFSKEEMELAQRVAEQVSGLLARVRLEMDHQQLEEQFRQAQKMEALGQMARGVAHDFNSLLTVIGTTLDLMERQFHPVDPIHEQIGYIREAGEQAAELTRQLLTFSRRGAAKTRVMDLNQAIEQLAPMLRRILGQELELAMDLAPDLWPVKIDPAQVDQVLVNLVMNAGAATAPGGTVSVETANVYLDAAYVANRLEGRLGEHILLAVHDTGEGMDEEVQRHLFEPFFTTRERGTGLGLSTVYGIVKHHGGHIQVDSEVGKGTSFYIYLPRTRQEAVPAAPQRRESQKTILLVEDERSVRMLAQRILEEYGYHVLCAEDGRAGLQVSQEYAGPIHLLLTDIVMPRMNGAELAQRLEEERPGIRVLYMSGYTGDVISRHGIQLSKSSFVAKPFNLEDLVSKVQGALNGAS